jgi:hypothetical protein
LKKRGKGVHCFINVDRRWFFSEKKRRKTCKIQYPFHHVRQKFVKQNRFKVVFIQALFTSRGRFRDGSIKTTSGEKDITVQNCAFQKEADLIQGQVGIDSYIKIYFIH